MASSPLYNSDGIEYPTRTTAHNQVIVVDIPAPSQDTIDNYIQLKNERQVSWDDIAAQVSVQDPALAEYLRKNGSKLESAKKDETSAPKLLTDLARNPLTTPEDRDAIDSGVGVGATAPVVPANTDDAGAHADGK